MDLQNNQGEMATQNYAMGTHILLVEPHISSLMHTTKLLEETNYKVTSTGLPEEALTMLQERANEFDMIMVASEIEGMDCLTFYYRAQTISNNTPTVLMTYKEDPKFAIKVLQEGFCRFLLKPIDQNDVRPLWQFSVRRKMDTSIVSEPENAQNDKKTDTTNVMDPKGKQVVSHTKKSNNTADVIASAKRKGKEKMVYNEKDKVPEFPITAAPLVIRDVEGNNNTTRNANVDTRKRKQPEKDSKERTKGKGNQKDSNVENKRIKKRRGPGRGAKKSVKWNPDLYEKFMRNLRIVGQKVDEQERETTDATKLTQGVSEAQKSKEQPGTPTKTADTSNDPTGLKVGDRQGAQVANTGYSPPIQRDGSLDNHRTLIAGSSGQSFATFGSPSFNIGTQIPISTSSLLQDTSYQPGVIGTGINNLNGVGAGANASNLQGRIEQIRQTFSMDSTLGQITTPANTGAILAPQAQQNSYMNYEGNNAGDTMSYSIVESMPLYGQPNWPQYETFNTNHISSSTEQVGAQFNMLGANIAQSHGYNQSNFIPTNMEISNPQQNMLPPNPNLNAPLYTPSNYPSPFMQNAHDLLWDPASSGTENNNFWGSNQMQNTGTGPNHQEQLNVSEQMPAEISVDYGGALSNSQMPPVDDNYDHIFPELQDFVDEELRSFGF